MYCADYIEACRVWPLLHECISGANAPNVGNVNFLNISCWVLHLWCKSKSPKSHEKWRRIGVCIFAKRCRGPRATFQVNRDRRCKIQRLTIKIFTFPTCGAFAPDMHSFYTVANSCCMF